MAQRMRGEKAAEWRERFDRFHRSGTSVAQFCRDEGISAPSFYNWRRKLGRKAAARAGSFRNGVVAAEPRRGSFVPVRVLGGLSVDGQMTAQLPGGTRLQIPLADPQTIQIAIAALVRADAERAGGVSC
jgi:transposase-like protein